MDELLLTRGFTAMSKFFLELYFSRRMSFTGVSRTDSTFGFEVFSLLEVGEVRVEELFLVVRLDGNVRVAQIFAF